MTMPAGAGCKPAPADFALAFIFLVATAYFKTTQKH
jgi:hypothetical protein